MVSITQSLVMCVSTKDSRRGYLEAAWSINLIQKGSKTEETGAYLLLTLGSASSKETHATASKLLGISLILKLK